MTSLEDLSKLVSRDIILQSIKKALGRSDVEIFGEPQVKRATVGIEGFTSTVLRVKVDYRFVGEDSASLSKVLFVKCLPQVETQLEFIKKSTVFLREGEYFDKVVPIVQEVSKGKIKVPLPECYACIYGGENDSLYMEDLTLKGFRSLDAKKRQDGMDLGHFVVALKSLGRLHGLLVAAERAIPSGKGGLLELAPALSKDAVYFNEIPGEPPSFMKRMFNSGMDNLLYFSKQIDGLPKEAEASGMLEKVSKRVWDTICLLTKPDSQGRSVLCHGDCSINNIMFRYRKDESGIERPAECKFIDLQISRYCHPSLDILYFLYLSAEKSLRDNHMKRLINDYYLAMLDTLNILEAGPPPLTLDELFDDLYGKYKPFGVITAMVIMPIRCLGDFVPPKVEDMTPEIYQEIFDAGFAGMARMRFDNDPTYRAKIEVIVREFVEMAFPDGLNSLDKSPLLI